jgi:hypothetical protein
MGDMAFKCLIFRRPYHVVQPDGVTQTLLPGVPFVLNAQTYHELACDWGADGGTLFDVRDDLLEPRPLDVRTAGDLRGKRVLKMRMGGIGDLLFDTPGTAELKRRGAEVYMSALPYCGAVLRGNSDYAGLLSYPVPLRDRDRDAVRYCNAHGKKVEQPVMGFDAFDFHCDLSEWEHGKGGETLPAVDAVAASYGLTLEDKRTRMEFKASELLKAQNLLGGFQKGERWAAVQPRASSDVRSWSPYKAWSLAVELHRRGWSVAFVGSATDDPLPDIKGVRNFVEKEGGREVKCRERFLNLCGQTADAKELAACLTFFDVVVGPDSAAVHIAAALGKPAVSLYGSFDPRFRTFYYERHICLYGRARHPCWRGRDDVRQGCMVHGQRMICGQPYCRALDAIEPEDVVKAIEDVVREETGVRVVEARR